MAMLATTLLPIFAMRSGHVTVSTSPLCSYSDHKLWFRVHRPELLQSASAPAPLLVVHGGPQVPSDYLFDLAKISDRAVVFYDQLGCGRSDTPRPDQGEVYSVESSLRDLRSVLVSLGMGARYHLYGQSWGGLLAAELAAASPSKCAGVAAAPLSLTLSNTPTSVPQVEAEATRLLDACGGDGAAFMAAHNLRIEGDQPPPLAAAYAHAGSTWRGTAAIAGVAVSSAKMASVRCPALVLRGEHDFVTAACVQGWEEHLPSVSMVTLMGASHHALLEQPDEYLATLGDFLREHD